MPILPAEPSIHPERLFDRSEEERLEEGCWWVLQTRPRSEKMLVRKLFKSSVPFFLPLQKKQRRFRQRVVNVYLPLFSNYVFLYGRDEERLQALKTKCVFQVLTVFDQRQLDSDLQQVYQLIRTGAPLVCESRLQPGAPVEITCGAFTGLKGRVITCKTNNRFLVEVKFIQQGVSVDIESWMIQPISNQDLVVK